MWVKNLLRSLSVAMKRSKQNRDKAELYVDEAADWLAPHPPERCTTRDSDEMLPSDEGRGYAASKCLSSWHSRSLQAASPMRACISRFRNPAIPGDNWHQDAY